MERLTRQVKNSFSILKYFWGKFKAYFIINFIAACLEIIPSVYSIYMLNELVICIENEKRKDALCVLLTYLFLLMVIEVVQSYLCNLYIPCKKEEISLYVKKNIYQVIYQLNCDEMQNSDFIDQYYFVLQNSSDNILSLIDICTNTITVILGILAIVKVISGYSYRIIAILVLGVIMSCIVGLKTKNLRKTNQEEKTNSNRRIDYIRRVFYQPEYAEEVRALSMFDLLISNLKENVDQKVRIIKKNGKKAFYL